MPTKIKTIYVEIIIALFVMLLLYTAIMKLRDINAFIYTIEANTIMQPFGRLLGWTIPILEIITCILLVIPRLRKTGLATATVLMVLFTGYVAWMLLTLSKLPCTCGGVIDRMGWKDHLIFNASFVMAGSIAIILYPTSLLQQSRKSRTPVKNSRHQLSN